ncbi:MAG: hypothetical protein L6U99_05955 [Clostridium sp.]|nr:MAG: hypothetical protein L6U99_05955 [Clostridium sp.]
MIDMEYIYNEISYLIEVGVNMIIMPETLEPLDNERLVNVVKSNVIIYGPAYYDFTNEGVYSIAKVHSREILPKEEFDVMKILPYVSRYDENNKTAKKWKKINPGDIFTYIAYKKIMVKFLLMICSDAF